MHWRILACYSVIAVACAGCAARPAEVPREQSPAAFEQQLNAQPHWPASDWHTGFASEELDQLVAHARQNNLDLIAAQARVRQADARARAAGAAILPSLDAGARIEQVGGGARGSTAHETDWSALFSASYEIDFWGKNRDTTRSASLARLATQADSDTVALTVQAGVANGYFQLLSLRERIDLANKDLAAARAVLQIIEARFNVGAASASELAAQRAAVANAELMPAQLQQQEMEARGALALLIGRAPQGFTLAARNLDGLNEPNVAPGLPAELLTRRPDIIAAETDLRAAQADLAAARAALFPTFTLTGSAGLQNPAVQAAVITLAGTGYAWSVGASVLQTIFDGGRKRALRDEVRARQQELLANYHQAILNALADVETALAAIHSLDLQRDAQAANLLESERAFEGAQLRYRAGSGDYLSVLDAQRVLSAAREQSSLYKLARLQGIVALCKALGGGWQAGALHVQDS